MKQKREEVKFYEDILVTSKIAQNKYTAKKHERKEYDISFIQSLPIDSNQT